MRGDSCEQRQNRPEFAQNQRIRCVLYGLSYAGIQHILPMLSHPINYHTSYQCSHALSIITHPTNALTSYQLSHTLSMLSHPIKQQTLQILTLPTNTNLLPINTHQTLSILT